MNIIYLDHHLKSVTGGHKYNDKFEAYLQEISGIKIQEYPSLPLKYPGWRKLFAPLLEISMIKHINKGDIVLFGDTSYKYHLLLLLLCKYFIHSKNVIIIHHFLFLDVKGWKRDVFKALQTWHYSHADWIIVPSPYTKDNAEKYLDKNKVIYVPLPFEKKCEISDTYNEGELLFVGMIEPRKGLHLLLQGLNILKKKKKTISLKIIGKVGNEEYYNSLKQYIADNGLVEDVKFLGRVSLEDLNASYQHAEMFVLPSSLEGYGIVLVEAMNHGLPLVAFDNSAMPYTIKPGFNGYLAKDGDVEDLAVQISKILCNREERKRLQQGVKEIMDDIKTEEDFKNGIREFYKIIQ